jgi:hypothetical protein
MDQTNVTPVTKLESRLNYLVGVTLMTNLYYLSGLFMLPSMLFIVACLFVCAYYFIKRIDPKRLMFYTNFWVISGFILFSIFLYVPELVLRGSSFNPNDIIRVLIYLFFVGWTVSIKDSWESLAKFFGLSSFIAIILLTLIGFFEKFFPMLFALVLPPNLVRGTVTRIGATLIDPNTYATALVVYFSVAVYFFNYTFKKGKFLFMALMLIPIFILIETSGSRQGILLFAIWLFSLGLKENWKLTALSLAGVIVLFLILFLVFKEPLQEYAVQNPNTSVARILFPTENKMSSLSNLERKASLEAGFRFIENNFLFFGPGSFGFQNAYDASNSFSGEAIPHNGPLFLWSQYGILTLYFFYFIYLVAKRAIKANVGLFFLFYLVQFLLLPNSSYYFLAVFLLLCIDAHFYFKVFDLKRA